MPDRSRRHFTHHGQPSVFPLDRTDPGAINPTKLHCTCVKEIRSTTWPWVSSVCVLTGLLFIIAEIFARLAVEHFQLFQFALADHDVRDPRGPHQAARCYTKLPE